MASRSQFFSVTVGSRSPRLHSKMLLLTEQVAGPFLGILTAECYLQFFFFMRHINIKSNLIIKYFSGMKNGIMIFVLDESCLISPAGSYFAFYFLHRFVFSVTALTVLGITL